MRNRFQREKRTFTGQPYSRRQQIYKWFNDVVTSNNLTFFYKEIFELIRQNKDSDALERFGELVDLIINTRPINENGDTLGYILMHNINSFGRARTILELFNNIILKRLGSAFFKKKKITRKHLKQLKKDIKTTKIQPKRVYGINKEGKRKLAEVIITVNRKTKTSKVRLRNPKTKRFLKDTKSFKKKKNK